MWKEYNMWNFERPSSWYEPDVDDDRDCRCRKCDDTEQTFDRASDQLHGIIEILYGTEPIEICELENMLDELCHYLKVELKPNAEGPNIMRRNDIKPLYILRIEELNKKISKQG